MKDDKCEDGTLKKFRMKIWCEGKTLKRNPA